MKHRGHALSHRYGRAGRRKGRRGSGAGGLHVVFRGPNVVVWEGGGGFFMWSPGGRLKFGLNDPRVAGGTMPGAIQHPSADGNYNTEREAGEAIRRFLAA